MLEHLTEFFGRTHLVVLHFPIALVLTAAAVELTRAAAPSIMRAPRRDPYQPSPTALTLLSVAVLTTLAATATGLVLGYDEPPRVDLHRILGIITAALVTLTAAVAFAVRRATTPTPTRLYLTLLTITSAAVALTGHHGGNLTHGTGFLTQPLADMVSPQPSAPPEPDLPELNPADFGITRAALDAYLSDVQPILTRACVECHGPDEAENDVRLDTLAHTLDPSTRTVNRAALTRSDLIYVIELPPGDPDLMPPPDHADQLPQNEIDVIRDWVLSLAAP